MHRLPELVDSAIELEVRKRLTVLRKKSEFARDWRDRHIAHTDLRLALEQSTSEPLAPASRQKVNEAIASIAAVFAVVEQHYCQAQTGYEHAFQLGDAEALLHVIRESVRMPPV